MKTYRPVVRCNNYGYLKKVKQLQIVLMNYGVFVRMVLGGNNHKMSEIQNEIC
jgi:hypothetical protein